MPIETSCPSCGTMYRVKDEYAGRTFRCKSCQSSVKVPDEQADPWDDLGLPANEDEEEDDFGPPVKAPVRKKKKRKKRRSSAAESIPAGVWVALVCIGLLMLFNVVGVINQLVQGNGAGAFGSFVRLGVEIGVVTGLLQRKDSARWTAVILAGLAGFLCFPGALLFIVITAKDLAQNLPDGLVPVLIALMAIQTLIEIVIIISLLLPSSSEFFTE